MEINVTRDGDIEAIEALARQWRSGWENSDATGALLAANDSWI